MVKLQESKNRFFVTVPKQFVKLVGWKRGQELVIFPTGEKELKIQEQRKSQQ